MKHRNVTRLSGSQSKVPIQQLTQFFALFLILFEVVIMYIRLRLQ